jgi:UDP-N-acetylmuramoyl-L-alanyl-D-glutamate--2,6-diaminopimelate ligase
MTMTEKMIPNLNRFLTTLTDMPISLPPDREINSLQMDSRQVKAGDIFVAIPCDDRIHHIHAAIEAGARVLVLDHTFLSQEADALSTIPPHVTVIPVQNARESLGKLAAFLYPQQPKPLYAVTGTNGKSSVVTFLRQFLGFLGHKAVSYGTVGLEHTNFEEGCPFPQDLPKLTTLDALSLHRLLHWLSTQGCEHFAFEASSHGLDQYRLHQAQVTVAGFTNLTHDHLDYHGTLETYFEAKARLFTQILGEGGTAVMNGMSPYTKSLQLLLQERPFQMITYGIGEGPKALYTLEARRLQLESNALSFELYQEDQFVRHCRLSMVGPFQVENVLCMLGMVLGGLNQGRSTPLTLKDILGDDREEDLLSHLRSARGRMELAGKTDSGAPIYVDYAHTPDALLRALQALRLHLGDTGGQLHVVFGCGGNRDALKRKEMGIIAHDFADRVIITDDNPRDEDPPFIRSQIRAHCPGALDISDRFRAIQQAIDSLEAKDILIVTGKGHETGQIVRDRVFDFDDVQVIQEILGQRSRRCVSPCHPNKTS